MNRERSAELKDMRPDPKTLKAVDLHRRTADVYRRTQRALGREASVTVSVSAAHCFVIKDACQAKEAL